MADQQQRNAAVEAAREKAYQASRTKQRDDTDRSVIRRVSYQEGFDDGIAYAVEQIARACVEAHQAK